MSDALSIAWLKVVSFVERTIRDVEFSMMETVTRIDGSNWLKATEELCIIDARVNSINSTCAVGLEGFSVELNCAGDLHSDELGNNMNDDDRPPGSLIECILVGTSAEFER